MRPLGFRVMPAAADARTVATLSAASARRQQHGLTKQHVVRSAGRIGGMTRGDTQDTADFQHLGTPRGGAVRRMATLVGADHAAEAARNGKHIDSYYSRSAVPRDDYPMLAGNLEADVVVLGGGLAGVNVALSCATRGKRVVVLESNKARVQLAAFDSTATR